LAVVKRKTPPRLGPEILRCAVLKINEIGSHPDHNVLAEPDYTSRQFEPVVVNTVALNDSALAEMPQMLNHFEIDFALVFQAHFLTSMRQSFE
jgi:hypothetical protein